MGQPMVKINERQRKTKTGFTQTNSLYQARNCKGCPVRSTCFKAKGNRIVERNHNLERYKIKIRENLLSEMGEIKRKQQTADLEPMFSHFSEESKITAEAERKNRIRFLRCRLYV